MIGFGTKSDTPKNIIETAYNIGYRFIDTKDTNRSISYLKSSSFIREKLFICSKLVGESSLENHHPKNVRKCCNNSLKLAGLSYWDLYYIHTTYAFNDIPILDTYKEMLNLKKDGLIRNVGLSNITYEQLETLLLNSEKPDYIQIEIHPYLIEERLIKLCCINQIKIVAHSPLGSLLWKNNISKEPLLQDLAKKYNVSLSQLIINWHISRGIIPIPSSNSRPHLETNYTSNNFIIEENDIKLINTLNRNKRVYIKPNHYESLEIERSPLPKRIINTDELLPTNDIYTIILNDITLKGFHITDTIIDSDLHSICSAESINIAQLKTDNFLTTLSKKYLPKITKIVCKNRIHTLDNNLQPVFTNLFHRDTQKQKCLKVIIYLCDVNKTNGPFKVIFPEPDADLTWYKDSKNCRLMPEEIHQKFHKDNILSIEGPKYTMIIFEGAVLHCGGFVQKDVREIMYLEYIP